MGRLDHDKLASRYDNDGRPLFDSLKHVWLSSLRMPETASNPASVFPDTIIISEPPPTRVLP